MSSVIILILFMTYHAVEMNHILHASQNVNRIDMSDIFHSIGRASHSRPHELLFSIKQNNLIELESLLMERSDPTSDKYQNWLTFDEIGVITNSFHACDLVKSWLEDQNITISWISEHSTYIKATGSIAQWENILSTEFYHYRSKLNDNNTYIRSNTYSLPSHIFPHVTVVFYTNEIPSIVNKHSKQMPHIHEVDVNPNIDILSGTAVHTTVSYLNSFYEIPFNEGSSQMSQAVFETNSEYFSTSDLLQFQQDFDLTVQPVRSAGYFETVSCDNGKSCTEGNLDIQYMMGIAQNTPTIYWYVDSSSQDPFLSYLVNISSGVYVDTKVHSISWGSIEQKVSKQVKDAFNVEAIKLGLMGVTIVVSSGYKIFILV